MTTAVVGLVLLGLGWAPQALATPHVPERGHSTTSSLSAGQLRREAAADRAQHLRWAGGSRVVWLGHERLAAEAAADRLQHVRAAGRNASADASGSRVPPFSRGVRGAPATVGLDDGAVHGDRGLGRLDLHQLHDALLLR